MTDAPSDHPSSGTPPSGKPPSGPAGRPADRVAEAARFTRAEEQALQAAQAAGTPPVCPRCAVVMTSRAIGGGSFGLGYQRQRAWLLCPSCRRSVLFDSKRGTRL